MEKKTVSLFPGMVIVGGVQYDAYIYAQCDTAEINKTQDSSHLKRTDIERGPLDPGDIPSAPPPP